MDNENSHNFSESDLDNSVLGKIISDHQSNETHISAPSKIALGVLSRLKDREKDVVTSRYGLRDSDNVNKETLESIGRRLSVTRERIRQIEKAVLKKITKKHVAAFKSIWQITDGYLVNHGGLVALDCLADYLGLNKADNVDFECNALRLVMSVHPRLKSLSRSALLKEGWVLMTSLACDNLNEIEETVVGILKDHKKPMPEDQLIDLILKNYPKLDITTIKGVLRVNAQLGMDSRQQWGLVSWSIIVPKRIRDKVFIVLEEAGKPLHFEKITKITQERFSPQKPILNRTVHNELISDKRFVLVGRGIYALRSWGYEPGVVSDVIKDVLEKAGKPMHMSEIIQSVLKRRQVKRNTIIANLQNRSLFKKAGKAIYTLIDDA